VVAARKPDLTIIDFSIGIEGNGPSTGDGGITVNVKNRLGSWLVLAGKDIMATDATAARVMNHHVPNIKQLTMGYDMGLGEINEESIEMIGEKLSDIKWTGNHQCLQIQYRKSMICLIVVQFHQIMK